MKKEFRDWLEEKKRDSTYSYLNNGKLIKSSPDIEKELDLVIKKYDELHKPPVIPQYVAEWVIRYRGKYELYPALRLLENNTLVWGQIYEWYRTNTHEFVNAYLTGEYEVAEEPLYYVINNENYFLLAKDKAHGFVFSTGGNSRLGGSKTSSAKFELTEQEIKNYDERFWPFAEPVEEEPLYHALIKGHELVRNSSKYWIHDTEYQGDVFVGHRLQMYARFKE